MAKIATLSTFRSSPPPTVVVEMNSFTQIELIVESIRPFWFGHESGLPTQDSINEAVCELQQSFHCVLKAVTSKSCTTTSQ
jgi:hypothetical protein